MSAGVPSDAPAGANPALEARIAPEVQTVTSAAVVDPDTLPPPPNRFSSVIERIERLYKVVFSFQLGCLFAPLLSYTTIELVWLRQRLLFPY
jgi:hypothetical protein